MINAKVMFEDDNEVCAVWLRAKPAVGEYLWLGDRGSFTIIEIAHWVDTVWSPSTHTGDPIHSLAIYVEKTARDASA
ncbi:hypothetical protein [Novosphingobium sp. JCM 18896]|uniref:hypothetical protein n=1 Tax=Novosphingobium sp. JCM 18896 TaxID=2989731 RepID=UPI002221A0BC|nr:hypothetical protein [Novosphingobium sp. JCM 18896]MCW1431385.1 hypothetical protein [Novosphingobium sp. JCM 18896]